MTRKGPGCISLLIQEVRAEIQVVQDRRQYQRLVPDSPLSVSLGESKSGLLFDLCEAGLAVDSLAPESQDELISIAFNLPEGGARIQSRAKIAWTSESRHRIGVRFVDLAEISRQQLREWVCARVYPTKLRICARSFSSFARDEWDNFVLTSGGSFLGCWAVVKARRLVGTVKLFEFFIDRELRAPQKVGQCAVAVTRGKLTFLDRIHLRPAQRHLWDQCFKLMVQRFGAKTYHYGSHWNDEDRFDFTSVPHFVVDEKIFHIDLIDFRDWADFRAYRRGVSENIRRDYKKAEHAAAIVTTRFGLAALRDLFALVAMRAHMMRRNKQHFSRVLDYFLHAAKLAVLGKSGFITTGRIKGRCYTAFFGAQVGSKRYYLSGGTRKNPLGVGSYLFLTLIEHWFSEHPTGKVLMGDCPGFSDQAIHTYGDCLYRRKLRVRSINGVEFQLKVKHSVCSDELKMPNTQLEKHCGSGSQQSMFSRRGLLFTQRSDSISVFGPLCQNLLISERSSKLFASHRINDLQ